MRSLLLLSVLAVACARPAQSVAPRSPQAPPVAPAARVDACTGAQRALADEADRRATPWSRDQHLSKNFPGGRVAWLMPEAAYQKYIVTPQASKFGRCNDTGCYLFVAPAEIIERVVADSRREGGHDPAALGAALGLPAKNFEGPLRMMVLDVGRVGVCVRLPVDSDPGVWKCTSAEDTSCFKQGGYTAGGIPELMVIDAPVADTTIIDVP
ncbi:MAG: hypothetical protein JNL83_11295 [Myxococcales bacterium]|nr:hypothetical protein [Myxococcales bacterium]